MYSIPPWKSPVVMTVLVIYMMYMYTIFTGLFHEWRHECHYMYRYTTTSDTWPQLPLMDDIT